MSELGRPLAVQTTPALVQTLARSQAAVMSAAFVAAGLTGLRPGQAQLLVPLLGGARHAVELAEHLGVSRQAVAQVVTTLERGGYVERIEDPADRRAKLIRLTGRGRTALRTMRQTALEIERTWADRLGEARLEALRGTLVHLLAGGTEDDRPAHPEPV